MKKVFVFCIGGTGIRVMKSVIMMMAGGMNTNGYKVVPVIVDPHLDLEEKKNLHMLIERYEDIHRASVSNGNETLNALDGFFGSEVQTLPELCGQANATYQFAGSDKMFGSYIGRESLDVSDMNKYLVETLFSTKNLNSTLSVGFKGNPNVGTVVLGNVIDEMGLNDMKGKCDKEDRIFIISSIFGGTGASGYPLLEKKIKQAVGNPTLQKAVMGAVTVLPYYALKDPAKTNSDIDSANFYTKTKAALAYYEDTVLSDYLYYVGERTLRQSYDNDEKRQDDKANFIELVAASALFDFLGRERPQNRKYMMRAIEDDRDSMDLASLGNGYAGIVKSVADGMLLRKFVEMMPGEKYFPLSKERGLDAAFYRDKDYQSLAAFMAVYEQWYTELATNNRAFAPLQTVAGADMADWVRGVSLEAKDDSYYLLEMIKASGKEGKSGHDNKLRHFLDFAYKAIDKYTSKINKVKK